MLNLLLHAGGRAVDRAALTNCPTPASTRTWHPVPHNDMLAMVEGTLTRSGMTIVNQAHALSRDGQRYFGLMELHGGQRHKDYALVVGLRNSHDQTYPAGLVLGSGVFVCDNLAFSGEVVLTRRHTRYIGRDLPQLVERAVGQLGELRVAQDQRIEAYKNTPLDDHQVHDLLIRCLDSRVLPVTRLPTALAEWRQPTHRAFEDVGRSGWRFFNAVTESIKGRNIDELPRRTQALHGVVDSACGLAVANPN